MAKHLASTFGTEKDHVNYFYNKTGACRHGNHCLQYDNSPIISRTLLLSNMYQRLDMITPGIDAQGSKTIDPDQIQEHFEDFYEDIFEMLSKYGEIMCLNVCDNLANYLIGNVYVKFRHEKQAKAAMEDLRERPYKGRLIIVDFSSVTDFFYASCRLFKENSCKRGFACNFLHVKKISRKLMWKLYWRSSRSRYSRSQSRNPTYRRDRESRKRTHERGDHRDKDQKRHERRYERRSRKSRYSESRSRSWSPSYRRDIESRERSHERGDHRSRDRERHEMRYERRYRRSRYSESRSRGWSPSYKRNRESRERSHERGDHRDRDHVRHEKMSRRSRYSESRSRSWSPSYRRDKESRGHMKEVIIGGIVSGTKIGKGM